jgi:hypothetical protein
VTQPSRRSSREAWALVALLFGIPLVWVALFSTLVFTVDPDSATAAGGYGSGGTWVVALVVHAARTLPGTVAGRADAFEPRLAVLGVAGLLASFVVALLNRFDVVDAATGITGELILGAFGVSALLVAILKRPRAPTCPVP